MQERQTKLLSGPKTKKSERKIRELRKKIGIAMAQVRHEVEMS